MMDDDEKKEKEKEDAEKKRRIEERKVKRAQRKLNKLNSKGAVGSGDGTRISPDPDGCPPRVRRSDKGLLCS